MSETPERFALPLPPRLARVLRDGVRAPERDVAPDTEELEIALVAMPSRRPETERDEGVEYLLEGLRARGNPTTLWREMRGWPGADIAVAVGWRSVPTVLRLPDLGARALLVLEDEPAALPASSEREWAEWAHQQGLAVVCAGSFLADQLAEHYGAVTHSFLPGVDGERHHPLPTHRRDNLVLLHAAPGDPSTATPLGVLALEELYERRPDLHLGLFGDDRRLATRFEHESLGVATPEERNQAFSTTTVGVALSVGAPSPVVLDMLACGLPVVTLDTPAARDAYPDDSVEFAVHDPDAVAEAIERLLDDLALRAGRARAGLELAAQRTWDEASAQVEDALRLTVAAARGA